MKVKKVCSDKKLIGEKSPAYTFQRNVAERLYKYNSDMKLIWIFRHPIKKACSNYWHLYKKGIDKLDFKTAVENEQQRIKEIYDLGYLKRSSYIDFVEEFLLHFDKNQMCILLFENLKKNPKVELKRVFDFLEVDAKNFKYYNTVKK